MQKLSSVYLLIAMAIEKAVRDYVDEPLNKIERIKRVRESIYSFRQYLNDGDESTIVAASGLLIVKRIVEDFDAIPHWLQWHVASDNELMRTWAIDVVTRLRPDIEERTRQYESVYNVPAPN